MEIEATVREAVRFLDDVVDVNRYPLDGIEGTTLAHRRIGLGVMGLHRELMRMGTPYDSEEALDVAHRVMGLVQETAVDASRELAEERGSTRRGRPPSTARPGPPLEQSRDHGGVHRHHLA